MTKKFGKQTPTQSVILDYNDFGTIQNNTALKRPLSEMSLLQYFGTIQNNTALKPRVVIWFG